MHPYLAKMKVREAVGRARRLLQENRYEESLEAAKSAHAIAVGHLHQNDLEYVLAIGYLGTARLGVDDVPNAIQTLEGIAGQLDSVLVTQPYERQSFSNNLAVAYGRAGRYEAAIEWMQRVVADKSETLGADSVELLGNLQDLANSYDSAKRLADALPVVRQMLHIIEKRSGIESRDYLQMLGNLSACLQAAGHRIQALVVRCRIRKLSRSLANEASRESRIAAAKKAYLRGDFEEAARLHRAVLGGTGQLPFPPFMAAVLGDLLDPLLHFAGELDKEGVAAENAKNFDRAIHLYRVVVEILGVSGDDYHLNQSKAIINLALAYRRSGDIAQAFLWSKMAVELLGKLLYQDFAKPIFDNVVAHYQALCDRDAPYPGDDVGVALAKIKEETGEKGAEYARSFRIRFPLVAEDADAAEHFRLWMDARIIFYSSAGAFEPARCVHRHVLECHELLFRFDPLRILAPLLSYIAFCVERGPSETARSLLNRAVELSAQVLATHPAAVAEILRWEARFLASLGDHLGSAEVFLNARELLTGIAGEDALRDGISEDLMITWLRMGKKGAEVDALVDEAIARKEQDLESAPPEQIKQLADLLFHRGKMDRAEPLYRRALSAQLEAIGENDPRYAATLSNLASVLRYQGRYAEAIECFTKVVRARELEYGVNHQSVAQARLRLVLSLGAEHRWDEAMAQAALVLRANEVFLQSAASVTSREQLFRTLEQERAALDVFISVALHSDNLHQAYRAMYEAILRRKGLGFEAISARRVPLLTDRYPEQKPMLQELDRISSILSEQLVSTRRSDADIRDAWARKRELEIRLAGSIPELRFEVALNHADLDTIRSALPEDSVLFEYALFEPYLFEKVSADGGAECGDARYLGFAIQKDRALVMVDLAEAAIIDECVGQMGRLLAGDINDLRNLSHVDPDAVGAPSSGGPDELAALGERLRQLIWDPLLLELNPFSQVLVAPDGTLGLLPFDLLPAGDGRLLLDTHLISNVNSGRDVGTPLGSTPTAGSAPVIVCAPDFDAVSSEARDTAAVRGSTEAPPWVRALDDRGVIRAAPLPGALDEGREVLEIAGPGQLHQGSQATVDALRELRSPVILHIATHGFSDRQDLQAVVEGMREALFGSGILLAGFNSVMSGVPVGADLGQGFLTGEDASTLSLGATQMVVLSACRTGLGAAVPREGIFGLHRAFAAAGAATVVMSLWKIPDRQTGELMALFYRHLRAGSSRAQALREAKRSVRDRYPHPFFWGAFLCHGDWRVIPGWKSNAQLSSQVTELPK